MDRPRPGKLQDLAALITGGDSGMGRAVAIAFAKEGANVAIVYFHEHEDARDIKSRIAALGRQCVLLAGDVGDPAFCADAVSLTVEELGRLDVLVNIAAEQLPQEHLLDITPQQLERSFRTNIFAYFYMAREALKHLGPGSVIINTSSVTACRDREHLVDCASTKAAIFGFTRSLALAVADQGVRVNGVAPGPIWPSPSGDSLAAERHGNLGFGPCRQRAWQPEDVAPSIVFLASSDSSYLSGQMLQPNGGEAANTSTGFDVCSVGF